MVMSSLSDGFDECLCFWFWVRIAFQQPMLVIRCNLMDRVVWFGVFDSVSCTWMAWVDTPDSVVYRLTLPLDYKETNPAFNRSFVLDLVSNKLPWYRCNSDHCLNNIHSHFSVLHIFCILSQHFISVDTDVPCNLSNLILSFIMYVYITTKHMLCEAVG